MVKTILIILALVIVIGGSLMILRGKEDNWIKDSRGVYVMHGNPSDTPTEVKIQQDLIKKAQAQYQIMKDSGKEISNGPCLGIIADDWVADIVHNPRSDADNLSENQCSDFRAGSANHFIELDLDGNVVRVQ